MWPFNSVDILSVILAVIIVIFAYFKWSYQYWKRRNVPTFPPSIPWGNFPSPFWPENTVGVNVKNFYNDLKQRNLKHGGFYSVATPVYIVRDLDYVKNIMTKDFQYFVDRGFYYNEEDDPLSAHLFAIGGIKWRNLRTKLTPTFTSGKMRLMFQTLVDCEHILSQAIDKKYANREPLDVKEILGCFTTNIIGSCAFGLEFNTFEEDGSPFRRYGKKTFESSLSNVLKNIFASNYPNLARKLGVCGLDKEVTKFFLNIVEETVDYRQKNNINRKDMLQLLIDIKNNKTGETSLTMEELAAQCFIFFLAGFETSSTTMTFALYELTQHQDIQAKVREEIRTVLAKHDNQITYESIQEMKYLNQVIEETLRKYPPLPFVTRNCVKDYKIPDENIIIEKGTRVIIPIMGIHYDEDHFPNPDQFDPDRFNDENKHNIKPYSHLPFGEGPRVCIGLRFGMVQSKVGLVSLLKKYKVTLSPKTKVPIKFDPHSFILTVLGDIWVDAEKVD